MRTNTFNFMLNTLPVLRYLYFCLDILVIQKNGLIRKFSLKIFDAAYWTKNNYDAQIDQYFKK